MNERLRRITAATLTSALMLSAGYGATVEWRGWNITIASVFVILGAAAFGFTRKSLTAQIAARGVVWLLFGFIGTGAVLSLFTRHVQMPWWTLPAIATSGGALWVSRALLDTKEALAQFAPVRYRRAFLAGATAVISAATGATFFAAAGLQFHSPIMLAFNASLAAVMGLAVHGLLKMKTWGALLGAFASLVCLAIVPFYGFPAFTLVLAALPALLFWILPIFLARRSAPAPFRLRVALPGVRVSSEPEFVAESMEEEAPRVRMAAR